MEFDSEFLSIESITRMRKPTKDEIFSALVDPDTQPDWDIDILNRADKKDIIAIRKTII